MNELKIFANPEFGEVRTVEVNGEPWLIGKDVAQVLGYSNPRKTLLDHVDPEDKTDGVTIRDSMNREQRPVLINESGLYSLCLSSKLPSAKKFRRWVTSEVLPAIRKHGAYMTDQKAYDITHNPESLADLLLQAGEQLKQKELIIQEMKPKALFADAVAASNASILVFDLAKILRQNGVKMGGNRLFDWLREKGYLIKRKGSDWNMPTQRSMEQGLFEIKESTHIHSDGHTVVTRTPKVTGKGQAYFVNKFLEEKQESLMPASDRRRQV